MCVCTDFRNLQFTIYNSFVVTFLHEEGTFFSQCFSELCTRRKVYASVNVFPKVFRMLKLAPLRLSDLLNKLMSICIYNQRTKALILQSSIFNINMCRYNAYTSGSSYSNRMCIMCKNAELMAHQA